MQPKLSMSAAFLNLFIHDNHQKEKHILLAQRALVILLLLMLLGAVVSELAKVVGASEDPFPNLLILVVVSLMLYLNKRFKSPRLTVNLLNVLLCGCLLYAINLSGGIYSMNSKWLFIVFMTSLMFLPRKDLIGWMLILLFVLIYVFFGSEEYLTSWEGFQGMDRKTYFFDAFLYILVFGCFVLIFYKLQEDLRKNLEEQKSRLESKSEQLSIQKKQLEYVTGQLHQSNQNLKNYAHVTSHDLKQPIRTISSFAQLVKRDLDTSQVTEKTHERIDFVVNATHEIKQMIEDILFFAQLDQADQSMKQEFCSAQLVEEVLTKLEHQIEETNARILVGDLPKVYGARTQLARVFQNLVSNSIKYCCPEHTPEISIKSTLQEQERLFAVTDNGIGIDPKNFDKIFEPFVQESNLSGCGYGIGLATCKEIIENHGGRIWVTSAEGNGSTFYFSLPRHLN